MQQQRLTSAATAAEHAAPASPANPVEFTALLEVAAEHVIDWKAKEAEMARLDTNGRSVLSLFELCKQYVLTHAKELPIPIAHGLPDHVADDLYAFDGRGKLVARAFVSEVSLQNAVPDGSVDSEANSDRVSISTIHRAKGLEWKDVYCPWFNEGLMPMEFREEKGNRAQRHVGTCASRLPDGSHCDKNCAQFYGQRDANVRGTAVERHDDEERRLAHVAATRAKDRLVFLTVESERSYDRWKPAKPSSYEAELDKLPREVLAIEELPG